MSLEEHEIDKVKAAIGYDAEVCEPNGKPVRAFMTARFGDEIRSRIIEAVDQIVETRENQFEAHLEQLVDDAIFRP